MDWFSGIVQEVWRIVIVVAILLALLFVVFSVAELATRYTKTTQDRTVYEFHCTGCGSEFTSSSPNPKDVNTCPNCPLTWEEFEELRKQALEKSK